MKNYIKPRFSTNWIKSSLRFIESNYILIPIINKLHKRTL